MAPQTGRVALIGAGHMGAAMLAGWLSGAEGPDAGQILVVDPSISESAAALCDSHGVTRADALDAQAAAGLSIVVFAVKPKVLPKLAKALEPDLPKDVLVMSVAAGVTLGALGRWLPDRPVVRAMPNTPAAIGKGATVLVANQAADAVRRAFAEDLLRPTGLVEWIEDERLMGAVTGVSGSGPAYVFLLAEALAAAGEAEGLPRDLAKRLAEQTVVGAGALLEREGDASGLRRAVTSPGGTTQAALDVLMQGLPQITRAAVNAAERRSRQLGGENS